MSSKLTLPLELRKTSHQVASQCTGNHKTGDIKLSASLQPSSVDDTTFFSAFSSTNNNTASQQSSSLNYSSRVSMLNVLILLYVQTNQ